MRTVVLASYNGERYIGEQLDSIVSQLTVYDEIVVSDDASTDRTIQIVAERNDQRIKIIANPTCVGYVKNFERAILNASGDDIFFSDQDDVWMANKMAVIQSALSIKACAVSDATVVDEDLRQLHPSYFAQRRAQTSSFWATFIRPCFIGATMACKKTYLASMMPFPPHVPHDFWVTLNAAWDRQLVVVQEPLILYRRHWHAASVSATANKRPLTTIFTERSRIVKAMFGRRLVRSISNRR